MKIEKNPSVIKSLSYSKTEENERFLEFIENYISENSNIDELALSAFLSFKDEIDCAECGECCKQVIVVFDEKDIQRLSSALGISENETKTKYFHYYEKFNVFIMNSSPCPFQKENLCGIYEFRGSACREFPYIDKNKFSKIYKYLFQGYRFCPFHFNTLEILKNELKFERLK